MKYVTIRVREDDEEAVKKFIKQRRALEKEQKGKRKKPRGKPPKLAAKFWKSNLKRVAQYVEEGEDRFQWEVVVRTELERWAALGQPIDETEFKVFCRRRAMNSLQKAFLWEALDFIGLKG